MTGTLSRHGFERELQPLYTRFAACAPGGPAVLAALVMIDLDHFKPINASAGHAAGDAMLVVPLDFMRIPLIAVVGWAFYAEALDVWVLVGALIIIAGVLWNLRSERARAT